MLRLPPPNSARVVAAHLASLCRKLIARTEPREDCPQCINLREVSCQECKGKGSYWDSRSYLREMKWVGKTVPCGDCSGKGMVACPRCDDDDWERATVSLFGTTVAADVLLEAVNKQRDVFMVVEDDDRIWLPKCAPIVVYEKTLENERVVARGRFDLRQIPLFGGDK